MEPPQKNTHTIHARKHTHMLQNEVCKNHPGRGVISIALSDQHSTRTDHSQDFAEKLGSLEKDFPGQK